MDTNFDEIKLDYIKTYLDTHLERTGIYDKLKKQFDNSELEDEDAIIKKLQEEGIIDNILENISTWDKEKQKELNSTNLPSKKGLLLKLKSANNFVDFIEADPSIRFGVDILFLGKRYCSKVIHAAQDMNFEQNFFLDFNLNFASHISNNFNLNSFEIDNLLKLNSQIHIVFYTVSSDGIEDIKNLIATKTIEWRWVLAYASWTIKSAEIYSAKSSMSKIQAGEVSLSISMLPFVDKKTLLPERCIFDQLNLEKKYSTKSHQEFVKFSNEWWEDYKNIRSSFSNRMIKLFVNTDDKENYSYKPASSVLFPITSGRGISTPYEAARFVSLIPYNRNKGVNNNKEEVFNSLHTFLALNYGDIEDHSVLLCNILLGFGLDAYIAVGISANGPHTWVITRSLNNINNLDSNSKNNKSNLKDKSLYNIAFWESLTGQRINVSDPKVFRFYKKIHCVYSDKSFYANIQADDTVFNTIYAFEDEYLWKSVPEDKINSVLKYDYSPDLSINYNNSYTNLVINDNLTSKIQLNYYNIHEKEEELEKCIKLKISQFRKSLELTTNFDSKLGYLLSPALSNYELERVSGHVYGNEEFKQSIKNYVNEGYTFKAYPCHGVKADDNYFFALCLNNDIGKDILYTRGDNIRFGVRCKIVPYPQGIYSIWMMIASKYRPVK